MAVSYKVDPSADWFVGEYTIQLRENFLIYPFQTTWSSHTLYFREAPHSPYLRRCMNTNIVNRQWTLVKNVAFSGRRERSMTREEVQNTKKSKSIKTNWLLQRLQTSPELGEHPPDPCHGPEDKLALRVRCSSSQGKSKRNINELRYESLDCCAGEHVSWQRTSQAREEAASFQLLSRLASYHSPAMPSLDPTKWTDILSISWRRVRALVLISMYTNIQM